MRRPVLHPLAGAKPSTLVRALVAHGGVAPRHAGQVALMVLAGLLRWPNSAVEAVRVARRVKEVAFDPSPVFIVGHWRSGTTYLHNLMSRDPAFCFPTVLDVFQPYDFYPSLAEKLSRIVTLATLPPTRPMDDVPIRPDLPQEDEWALASMASPSFQNCYYFPRATSAVFAREVLFEGQTPDAVREWGDNLRYYLAKLVALRQQRRLLLKSPAHSARIPQLRELFPGAKFIHIHRDPRAVVKSTGKLFRKMLPLVALQDYDIAEIDAHILWAYPRLMDRLFAGLGDLPAGDATEVRYDDLVREPVTTVEGVYRALDLGDFDRVRPLIDAFAAESRSIRADTQHSASEGHTPASRVLAPYVARLRYEADRALPAQDQDVDVPGSLTCRSSR